MGRVPAGRKVLLVGWDGADWKIASPLIDRGELPQLANIVAHGASGPLASLPPYLSPMLWNSIATGKYADQHGITGFAATDPLTGKLQAMTSAHRKCKAVWNILSEQGKMAHVVGWFASHPAENVTGICVSEAYPRPPKRGAPWPIPPGAIHPLEVTEEFAPLRLRPEDVDPEILRLFIPRISEIDLRRDARPRQLAVRLAELYTVHHAAIAAMRRGPFDFLGVYYHFIDWVCHDFMDFHPPRRPEIPEREFAWYGDVVNSAYRLQDLLLRDLLAHAGTEATVVLCSDHGFHSDVRRPTRVPSVSAGIAIWHRAQGIFAAAGPGIARDALVSGATVLDITPTILHLFGLPVGADMDGHIIRSALPGGSLEPARVSSWENEPGPYPRSRHGAEFSPGDRAALLEQFADLGYVDLTENGPDSPTARNDRDNNWNLAITLRHAGKSKEALRVLESLHRDWPEDARFACHLALCQCQHGQTDEAAATSETILDHVPGSARAWLLLAEIALARGQAEQALEFVAAAEAIDPNFAGITFQRGAALLRQKNYPAACVALRSAVESDDEDPAAWLALAQALVEAGHPVEAEVCAREGVALAPTMAFGYLVLGQALIAQQKASEAERTFEQAKRLNPRLEPAIGTLTIPNGQPYRSTLASFADRVGPESDRESLRAESELARTRHHATQAGSRSRTTPCSFYQPPPKPAAVPATADTLVVVSGLPRSGTSLMMQMLARGGLRPMTDERRAPDENNPEGYFEWEEIKRLPHDPEIVTRATGRAVKVISSLLRYLPRRHRYKIIFMRRPAAEVARSQHAMLGDRAGAERSPETMQPVLDRHAEVTLAELRAAPNVELLIVDYPALVASPDAVAARVAEFLGETWLPSPHEMAAAVQPGLYRQRGAPR